MGTVGTRGGEENFYHCVNPACVGFLHTVDELNQNHGWHRCHVCGRRLVWKEDLSGRVVRCVHPHLYKGASPDDMPVKAR